MKAAQEFVPWPAVEKSPGCPSVFAQKRVGAAVQRPPSTVRERYRLVLRFSTVRLENFLLRNNRLQPMYEAGDGIRPKSHRGMTCAFLAPRLGMPPAMPVICGLTITIIKESIFL